MALDLNRVQEAIDRPSKQHIIKKAVLLEKRLRLHTEPNIEQKYVSTPVTEFLNWVSALLPKDKYNIFLQLFKLPAKTVPVVERAYEELERVFNSKNHSTSYRFKSTELLEDWMRYRKTSLHEPDIWKNDGWKQLKTHPNSILIIDLPKVQTGALPEPYFYWLDISNVIDYEIDSRGKIIWLIFKQTENTVAVFDDTSIRIYELQNNKIKTELVNIEHGLKYCPAMFFWTDSISADEKSLKCNPITKKLADLDWYMFFAISKQHLDLYAPYPIYSAYEADCNFENNETGDYCDGGFLRNINGEYKMFANGQLERCPVCGEKRIAGPGSFLEIPIPNQAEGVADMRNPVQITMIDRESLDYNVKELERLQREIISDIVGTNDTVSSKEAVNEVQIIANFESRTSVLNALKTNFEIAQRFVEDTVCRLRYGNNFISSSINWGTEFYVYTVSDLYKQYETAKKSGISNYELDSISQQILEVEYKNNPLMLQRMQILRQLEPYQNMSIEQLDSLREQNLIDNRLMLIKINFLSYITRFERENIDIVEFASAVPMKTKIQTIFNKLLDYATEDITTIEKQWPANSASVQN